MSVGAIGILFMIQHYPGFSIMLHNVIFIFGYWHYNKIDFKI